MDGLKRTWMDIKKIDLKMCYLFKDLAPDWRNRNYLADPNISLGQDVDDDNDNSYTSIELSQAN